MGENRVMVPQFRHVLDVGEHLMTFEQPVPHEFEHGPRHVGMAHDGMRGA